MNDSLPEIINPGQASDAPTMLQPSHNAAAAMSREMAQVQVQVRMAMAYPRDEVTAAAQIVNACRRADFAADAEYKFPRGGSEVSGPSVYLAREAKRLWGRMISGTRILERTSEEVLIEGYAMDLQTLAVQTAQQRVKAMIQRKQKSGKTEWVEPDERDFAELAGRVGAKLERNCILALVPSDVIEEACRVARETCRRAASGQLEADRPGQIRALVAAFSEYGVMRKHLEEKVGHTLDAITPDEITNLRTIYKTISAGEKGAADFFNLGPAPSAAESKTAAATASVKEKVAAIREKKGASPDASAPAATPAAAETTTPPEAA